jgi:hypothetical protein
MSARVASLVSFVVLLCSCGGPQLQDPSQGEPIAIPGVDLPGLDHLPVSQRAAFSDGAITTAEYSAAYRAFEECANAAGRQAIVDPHVDPVSGYISYGVFEGVGGSLEDPTSDTGRCYESEFHWIELVWEATDPTYTQQQTDFQLDQFESEGRPCLNSNGVDVPADVAIGSDTYGRLVAEWAALANAGKC